MEMKENIYPKLPIEDQGHGYRLQKIKKKGNSDQRSFK